MKNIFKVIILFFLFTAAPPVLGAGTSDNEYIMGDSSTDEKKFCLNRSCTNVIRVPGGGGDIEFSDDGVGFKSLSAISANDSELIENVTADTSVASSALTVALKIADGTTDPVSGNSVKVSFRDSTAADGAYNIVEAASGLNVVVPSGATLGHTDGNDGFIYVYVLDNSGTIEMAVSSSLKDESSLQTSVTIDTSSDDDGLYSTTGRSNVPIRLIARLKSNQVTAGTWDLDVIENSPGAPIFTDLQEKKIESTALNFRIESMVLDQNGVIHSILTENGSWIDNITRNDIGDTTLNIKPGLFSAAILCSLSPTSSNVCLSVTAGTSTAKVIKQTICSTAAPNESANIEIICKGPK